MKQRAVLAVLLFSLACQRETQQPTTTTQRRGVKTTTIAAPPVDLAHKKIKEEIPLAPVLIDDKGIGSKVAADGSVSGEQKTFKTTDPISVMMNFHESPHGLQSSIVVTDPKGAKVYRDQRAMNGTKMVTFTIPPKKLKPGHYRVDGYWGGNVAVEYEIEVK